MNKNKDKNINKNNENNNFERMFKVSLSIKNGYFDDPNYYQGFYNLIKNLQV